MQSNIPDLTRIIHHSYRPPEAFEAPQPGVFKASTVYFPSVAEMRSREWKDKTGYTYGLHGTPTTYLLEERLCALEGGVDCVLVPSGLSALSTVNLAVLESGDEVLMPDNVYGPNKVFAEGDLLRFGVTHQYYDPMSVQDLANKLNSKTRLVWLEAPGSVSMEFPDLVQMIGLCRQHGVLVALDNTWGAGLALRPFDLLGDGRLGVDISAHALTKYPSGGGDVLMGSIITRDPKLHLKIKLCHMRLGLGVAANDAETLLRSLSSIGLRYKQQDQTGREVAGWLRQQAACVQLLHPAFEDSPGHAHWLQVCQREGKEPLAAGLFSIMLSPNYTQQQVDAFCDGLKLFRLGYSWGGPVSLVVPYQLEKIRQRWTSHLRPGTLVRFSMGLESAAALIEDLEQSIRNNL
jgi:cystathionine beta-lyase